MSMVNKELEKLWKDGKKRIRNKAKVLVDKCIEKEEEPEMFEGVCIGDRALEKVEIEKGDTEDNGAPIYGGVEDITNDEKEILNLPPNHRTYPKLNLESFKTELQKCVIKAQWQKQRELREHEEKNHNQLWVLQLVLT